MVRTKKVTSSDAPKKIMPASTPEARENEMISLAEQLAEQQLRDGTASAQVITHYLKLGSSKERLEKEQMESKIKLLEAQVQAVQSSQKIEELYTEAINAMRVYSGHSSMVEDDDEYD